MPSNVSTVLQTILDATKSGKLSWRAVANQQFFAEFPDVDRLAVLSRSWKDRPLDRLSAFASVSKFEKTESIPTISLSVRRSEDGEPVDSPLVLIDSRQFLESQTEEQELLEALWTTVVDRLQAPPVAVSEIVNVLS